MAAKKAPPDYEALALQSLGKLLTDPLPRVLHGTKAVPGYFGGAKADKEMARQACERQWLEKTGVQIGKGAKAKDLYRITPAGVHAVLSGSDAGQLLRGMQAGVDQATEKLRELAGGLGPLQVTLHTLQSALGHVAEKVRSPDLEAIRQALTPQPRTPPPVADGSADETLGHEVERLLRDWKDRGELGDYPLPKLYHDLRARHPSLGIGRFHDELRRLHRESKVRFGNWGRPLDDIPEPDLAVFVSHKVMYYVRLA